MRNQERIRESKKRYREKNREKLRAAGREYAKLQRLIRRDEINAKNSAFMARDYKSNTIKYLVRTAKHRSKRFGLPFDLTVGDVIVPTHCPVFGTELLSGGTGPRGLMLSLDKVIPSLGYIRGNVRVISMRANRLKNDGTAEDFRKILHYIDSHSKSI